MTRYLHIDDSHFKYRAHRGRETAGKLSYRRFTLSFGIREPLLVENITFLSILVWFTFPYRDMMLSGRFSAFIYGNTFKIIVFR